LQLQDLPGWLGHHHLCPIPQKIAFLQPHKYTINLGVTWKELTQFILNRLTKQTFPW
jgi:hypothetical protein